jgi:hypothetical protein
MDEKKFISLWIQTLNADTIKSFPKDFSVTGECKAYNLPGKGLLIGNDFFGEIELIDAEGAEVLRVDSYEKAKFIIYANRTRPDVIFIPIDPASIIEMNSRFETYLDSLIKRIDQDYRKRFPASKNFTEALNQIFKHLNLTRLK